MFSRVYQKLHVFLRLAAVAHFPAFITSNIFSHTSYLTLVKGFPALGASCIFSRAKHRLHIYLPVLTPVEGFPRLVLVASFPALCTCTGCVFASGNKWIIALSENETFSQFYRQNLLKHLLFSCYYGSSFSGTPMWVLLHVGPIKNEKGEVMLFLVTLKDITEFKEPIVGAGNYKQPQNLINEQEIHILRT